MSLQSNQGFGIGQGTPQQSFGLPQLHGGLPGFPQQAQGLPNVNNGLSQGLPSVNNGLPQQGLPQQGFVLPQNPGSQMAPQQNFGVNPVALTQNPGFPQQQQGFGAVNLSGNPNFMFNQNNGFGQFAGGGDARSKFFADPTKNPHKNNSTIKIAGPTYDKLVKEFQGHPPAEVLAKHGFRVEGNKAVPINQPSMMQQFPQQGMMMQQFPQQGMMQLPQQGFTPPSFNGAQSQVTMQFPPVANSQVTMQQPQNEVLTQMATQIGQMMTQITQLSTQITQMQQPVAPVSQPDTLSHVLVTCKGKEELLTYLIPRNETTTPLIESVFEFDEIEWERDENNVLKETEGERVNKSLNDLLSQLSHYVTPGHGVRGTKITDVVDLTVV
jgi:hypothetical protein